MLGNALYAHVLVECSDIDAALVRDSNGAFSSGEEAFAWMRMNYHVYNAAEWVCNENLVSAICLK